MKKSLLTTVILLLVVALVVGCGGEKKEDNQSGTTFPNKPIEFVVPYSAGGGSDINARTVAEIVQKHGFVNQPLMVQNRTGGSGAVGNAYTYGKRGDDHTLMVWNTGQMLSTRVNNAEVTIDKLTPIAVLAFDETFIAVKTGEFESFDDLLEAALAKPGEITIGGAALGSEDHMIWGMINKYTGADFAYVAFGGAGEFMSALLGGHIHAAIFQPNEMDSQLAASAVTPIAYLGAERLPGNLDYVPTFAELGYPEIRLEMFRGYVGPPDMPEAAVQFYSELFRKVYETDEWQKEYCERFLLTPVFMDYKEAAKFIKAEEEKYLGILKETGIIK